MSSFIMVLVDNLEAFILPTIWVAFSRCGLAWDIRRSSGRCVDCSHQVTRDT